MPEHHIRLSVTGGPEVMTLTEVVLSSPGAGEAQIRHSAIGVNYLDVLQRLGVAPLALPSGIGFEGAGIVTAVGEGVTHVRPGERVAYAGGPPGAYATARNLPAHRLVALPDTISDEHAAAFLFKGLTAQYLLRDLARAAPGQTLLVFSAAGGVGQILACWGAALGARIIGVVSSEAKVPAAQAAGCALVLVWGQDDIAQAARAETNGRGVDVVLDAVGRDTLDASLGSLRQRGLMVSYGAASGAPPPVEIGCLGTLGSLMLTRPSVFHYTADTAEYRERTMDLFSAFAAGHLPAASSRSFGLNEAAAAHRDLQSRTTTGALLLVP